MADIFRPPIVTRIRAPDPNVAIRSQTEVAGNPGLLLATVPPVPLHPLDWPNPSPIPDRTVALRAQMDVWANRTSTLFVPPGVFLFRTPLQTRIWAPDPSVAIRSQSNLGQDASNTLLFTSVQTPFTNYDWPVPRGASFPSELRSWIGYFTLEGLDQFFGDPGQVPTHVLDNPRGAPWPSVLRTWTQSSPLAFTSVPPAKLPFGIRAADPNPTGWPFPSENRGFLHDLNLLILNKDQLPFGLKSLDLPPPGAPWPPARGFVQGLNLLFPIPPPIIPPQLFPRTKVPGGPLRGRLLENTKRVRQLQDDEDAIRLGIV